MRRPYSIRLFNYDATSGGIKVMYALYGALLLKGEEIIGNAVYTDSENAIGIYPEISQGNELQTGHVVRYILNKPGVMCLNGVQGPTSYPETDIQFVFSKMFAPDTPDDRLLFLPVINTEVFYDQGKKRTKKAVFVGKGQDTMAHPEECILIDRTFARDQQALADLLNECEVLYTYDPVSAMTEVCRLCGCRVVYLSDVYSEKDYELYEPTTAGMSFGGDEGKELDCEAFTRHYKSLYDHFWNVSLVNFISLTQNAT